MERHRLQFPVVRELMLEYGFTDAKILHIAPERIFRPLFEPHCSRYLTGDLEAFGIDVRLDLQCLPFANGAFDFVMASNVLEHVPDDRAAIREIWRVLKNGGAAVLPIPLIAETTVEYPGPNPFEAGHVRAPGYDYFERFEQVFSRVDKVGSWDLSPEFQTYSHEDRSAWPTQKCPLRPSMQGTRFPDIVPICYR